MPYIPQERRFEALGDPASVGELTYALTFQALWYAEIHGHKFQTYAEILGALEATKQELYRRVIAPYEDRKAQENGDVYS